MLIRNLLFLAALTGASFGQNSGPPTREVFLRLLAFDSRSIPAESFAIDPAAPKETPGTAAPIKNYLNHEGVKLSLLGNNVLFSKSSAITNASDAEASFAKLKLPANGKRFVLIFLPAEDQKLQVFAFDDSLKEFPAGAYKVFNLSKFPVKLTLEKKPYDFMPGKSGVIIDPPVQENNHSAMYAFSQVDGKWQRIGSGLWPSLGKKRAIQFFFDNPVTQRTELRGFRDISTPTRNPVVTQQSP